MRILLTGSGGVVGSEVLAQLAEFEDRAEVTAVTRRPSRPTETGWVLGAEPAPQELRRRHWDVIVHSAASTRWTMTKEEAITANVRTTEAVLELADADTHVVHISTAYVDGQEGAARDPEYGLYRNGYEWSKAESEDVVRTRHAGPLTIVRPPLVFGRSTDGAIARLSGPYAMVQSLISGLAPALVGDPDGFIEISPVDQVAQVIVAAALGSPPAVQVVETIAGGERCLRVSDMVAVITRTINEWRAERGIAPIPLAPVIPTAHWHGFYLPLSTPHLSDVQQRAVDLLSMFESYTSIPAPFTPTKQVRDPADLLARSVRWWADAKPRHAKRLPEPWQLVAA
ncbi:SDR family oxidoreductase [Streptomyces sp. NPDC047043]|uniref:SDR family oxidoreductase n=1 Tax=Streptomyces sp. NPDC047043 TaxID=3154497 RepID=UPI0033DDDCEA